MPGSEHHLIMPLALTTALGRRTITMPLSTLSHMPRAIESAVIKTQLYWVKPYAVVFVVQNWLNFGNSYGLAK